MFMIKTRNTHDNVILIIALILCIIIQRDDCRQNNVLEMEDMSDIDICSDDHNIEFCSHQANKQWCDIHIINQTKKYHS